MFSHPLANIATFLVAGLVLKVLADMAEPYGRRILDALKGRGGWE